MIKVFDAFQKPKKFLHTLVPIFILKAATKEVARNNSDALPRALPLPIHHNRKKFRVEVFGAKDPFFYITQIHSNMCFSHPDMTNSQGASSMTRKCIESMRDLQNHLTYQIYIVNTIFQHQGEVHLKNKTILHCFPDIIHLKFNISP